MMRDKIYRDDAIDAISTWDKFGIDGNRVVRWHEGLEPYVKLRDVVWAIEKMPSAEQWILCSERLPIKDDCVFVYLFGDSPYIAWHDGVDWCTEDFPLAKDEEPKAWMPLPEPYER